MKTLSILLFSLLSSAVCFSQTVVIENENIAVKKVIQSIEKHQLTTLNQECLFFLPENRGNYYEIEVRENHNKKCGGDPQTSPRLFTYEVDKQTGKMKIDDPVSGNEMRKID